MVPEILKEYRTYFFMGQEMHKELCIPSVIQERLTQAHSTP
jgi:hypothetical protein